MCHYFECILFVCATHDLNWIGWSLVKTGGRNDIGRQKMAITKLNDQFESCISVTMSVLMSGVIWIRV